MREDGFIFEGYKAQGYEQWNSPLSARRKALRSRLRQARLRTPNLPFDLDVPYVESIWPEDGRCPVLGIELTDGRSLDSAAELDRIVPDKGYTRGNVVWISKKANRIKSDATTAEICAVADYLKRLN